MQKLKKLKPYLINSLITIAIFLIILAITKTYPFGSKTIGNLDAIYQVKPMLYNFIMKIKTNTLLNYSFNNGLGNPLLFNYIYYLVSPLNLIAILFKTPNAMFLSVIIIKLFFTGLNVTYYAKSKGSSDFASLIATITYAFSSWFMAYYYNIMWLDTFMIFPLFQLGLEKLIDHNKPYLFIFSLAYLYATNYLLAFSCLIYMLIYFIIKNFFYDKKELTNKFKTLGIFLLSIIISALLITFHLKVVLDVHNLMGTIPVEETNYLIKTTDAIKSLFFGNFDLTTIKEGNIFPNITVNTLGLIACLFTFFNKNISIKDKVYTFIGIDLVLFCIFIPQLDFVMNMFRNNVGYPYRYSFIFSFLLTMLLIKNLNNYDKKDYKKLIGISIFLILLVLIIHKSLETTILIFNIVSLVLLAIMSFILKDNRLSKVLLSLFIIIQTIFIGYRIIPSQEKDNVNYAFTKETTKYRLNRIDKQDRLNFNLYANQNTTYEYTTMKYNLVNNTYYIMGCQSGSNLVACDEDTKLFNILFNVKGDNYLEKIYAVKKDITKSLINDEHLKNTQENIILNMTGIEDIFNKEVIKGTLKDDKYVFELDKYYYLIDDDDYNYVQIYNKFSTPVSSGIDKVNIYTYNDKKLKAIYDYLKENQIEYTTYEDNHIIGNINVDEDQLIFTSIPYDKNWIVLVDDQKVEPIQVLDSLLGIEVEPGKHKIELKYKTNYKAPIIISSLTFVLLIISLIINTKKKS